MLFWLLFYLSRFFGGYIHLCLTNSRGKIVIKFLWRKHNVRREVQNASAKTWKTFLWNSYFKGFLESKQDFFHTSERPFVRKNIKDGQHARKAFGYNFNKCKIKKKLLPKSRKMNFLKFCSKTLRPLGESLAWILIKLLNGTTRSW